MACKQLACHGADELFKFIEQEEKQASKLFVLCTSADDPTTGKSWCPDCVRAEPVIEKCIPKAAATDVFIVCIVGDRPTWKDPENIFRTHEKLKLKSIPTLIKWGTSERLSEEQCADANLVSMLLEE